MGKTYSYVALLVGAVCVYYLVRIALFPQKILLRNALIQGALIGFGLAFVSAQIYARIKATKVNGWISMIGLGRPSNGMFLRAAHAQLFTGPAWPQISMVRSMSIFNKRLRRDTSPTGYPHLRAILFSGCASTSPARPSSRASTSSHRWSK